MGGSIGDFRRAYSHCLFLVASVQKKVIKTSMKISDVAKYLSIPVSTIRYYERKGIIPKPSREGRNRSFSDKDVRSIQFVRDAQSVGFSLKEISELLRENWDATNLAQLASQHLQTVRTQIETLQRMERALSMLKSCRCRTMDQCNLQAGVIET
jgi:MerR family mercuric resistance operon transcriptional regulator